MSSAQRTGLVVYLLASLIAAVALACQAGAAQEEGSARDCEEHVAEGENNGECEAGAVHQAGDGATAVSSQPGDAGLRADLRDATPTPAISATSDGELQVVVFMQSPSGDWQTGRAALRAMGDSTEIAIAVAPPQPSAQPAHIHAGSCEGKVGAVVAVLESVVGGESLTVVDVPLAKYANGEHLVMVHLSTNDFGTYTACGNLPALP